MDTIIIFIVKKLKHLVDNLYYSKYHINKSEPLVRKMFPWIDKVSEYSFVTEYVKDMHAHDISNLNRFILNYYWWEVAIATVQKNFEKIKDLNVLVELTETISDFHTEILISNHTDNNGNG